MKYSVESGESHLRPAVSTPLHEARFVVARVCDTDPATIDSGVALAHNLQTLAGAIITIAKNKGDVELFPLGRARTRTTPRRTMALVRQFNDREDSHAWQARMFLAHQTHDGSAAMSMHVVKDSSQWPLYDIVVPTDRQLGERLYEEDPSTWRDTHTVAQDFRSGTLEQAYPFHCERGDANAVRHYFDILRQLSTDLLTATEQ